MKLNGWFEFTVLSLVLISHFSDTAHFSNRADHMECFIQFMARRELIANKIEKFDDCPENYNTWKAAFKKMTNDVKITASEEPQC